jgi:hypothetical protein
VLESDPAVPDEWTTLLRLAGVAAGAGPGVDVAALDEMVARTVIERERASPGSPLAGRSTEEVLADLAPHVGPERILDLLLRAGPYELSLDALLDAPHGTDLGPLTPRLPGVLRTRSGRIELAPEEIVADVARLRGSLDRPPAPDELVLIGRRHLRSNNSWMHNLPMLAGGPDRCTLQIHPADAARLGLIDGEPAAVRSRTGELVAKVEVTDELMPGVVSLPHGWGHDDPEAGQSIAAARPGVNSNALGDETLLDAVSGNAVLNGIPVALAPVAVAA